MTGIDRSLVWGRRLGDEPRRGLRYGVDGTSLGDEIGHARIIERGAHHGDIGMHKVEIIFRHKENYYENTLDNYNGSLTLAQTEGPYYTPNSPERSSLVEAGMGGTPLLVTGRVFEQDCQPITGAKVDFWQTDDQGQYDNSGYRLRGHQYTDENGVYALETIVPGQYPGRTAHIHVKVFAPDGRELLTTQIYIPGLSDQTPDGIYRPELLAQDLEPEADGRRRLGFNFVVFN